MKFVKDDGEFDIEGYKHAVRIVFTAQEIIVDNASYPTPRIGENSRDFGHRAWATPTSGACS